MPAAGGGAEVPATLEQLQGPGKRRRGSLEEPSDLPVPAVKIQKRDSPTCLHTFKTSPSEQATHPSGLITKANLLNIRDQLSSLTLKNQEIKTSIHTWRETIVDELFTHMRVRNIALAQLGRRDIDEEMRGLCLEGLKNRKRLMVAREDELLHLEKLLNGHAAVLEFADSAYEELIAKVKIFDELPDQGQDPGMSILDFPEMTKLARLTGGESVHDDASVSPSGPSNVEVEDSPPFSMFTSFRLLPTELRLSIWRAALPTPRIITHNPSHNSALTLLSTCHESRTIALSSCTKLLSIPPSFPQASTPVLYIDPAADTIVRDLMLPKIRMDRDGFPNPPRSIFRLSDQEFNLALFGKLTGLARVNRVALAFDLLNENGGVLFGAIQACCPNLNRLSLFPSSQFRYRYRIFTPPASSFTNPYKLLTLDSNVLDYIYMRHSMLTSRKLKKKAQRGLDIVLTLANHAQQYMEVFPTYVSTFGRGWQPIIRVCLLLHFNEVVDGWQSGPLEGDRYSKSYTGDDGRRYKGFVESLKLVGKNGELLSRYDGMAELFHDGDTI